MRSLWIIECPIRPSLESIREAITTLMRRKWGNQAGRNVEAGEVFALMDKELNTYKGKLIVSWRERGRSSSKAGRQSNL